MAIFYLIRHGEPNYDAVAKIGFFGFGRSFAPLSEKGIKQAESTSKDRRLLDADVIISSPYTRALQTAAIISREVNKPIIIEPELHEWIADKSNTLSSNAEAVKLSNEFNYYKGAYPDNVEMKWETLASVRERMKRVADKYADYNKVIIVGHGMAFRTLTYIEKMAPAQLVECVYQKGQPDCEYSFF